MSEKISRLAYLLGEMRRQMNGAVAGGMRFYGAEYGLNYGVSIPTIRSIAREEISKHGVDHRFARQLYQQEVRELRLAALWLADLSKVGEEMDFWAKGIINSEIAEEAAFALFSGGDVVDIWLASGGELLRYCAIMSIAKRGDAPRYLDRVVAMLDIEEVHIIPKAIVILLDSALRCGADRSSVDALLGVLSESKLPGVKYICEEMAWRVEM